MDVDSITYQDQSFVTNSAPTLSFGTTGTIGSVAGVNLTVTMPSNPNVWKANSSTSEGYVDAGGSYPNMVWATSDLGSPSWSNSLKNINLTNGNGPTTVDPWVRIRTNVENGNTGEVVLGVNANGETQVTLTSAGTMVFYYASNLLVNARADGTGNMRTPTSCLLSTATERGFISQDDTSTTTTSNNGYVFPVYDGELDNSTTGHIYIGNGTYRIKGIYSRSSINVSSDKNFKTNVNSFDSRYETAYMTIEPITFMWKNFESDDNHDRLHYGFLAQDIERAFNNAGITTEEMGFLCKDNLAEPNAAGEIVEYSMKYEELIALNTHMTQKALRKIDQLEQQIAELQQEITALKSANSND